MQAPWARRLRDLIDLHVADLGGRMPSRRPSSALSEAELAAITPRPRVKAPGNAGTVRRRFRRIDPAAARIVMLEAGPHHA
jgi:transposase InsO family protein